MIHDTLITEEYQRRVRMASSKGNEVLENLSERKKNLLEARFLRQAPSSLDGLSTGSRSTSCSPASFQKQHQGLVNEEGMGRSPTPSLFLSPGILGRQKSAEPTVLDMTDTNSGGDESRENCLQTSLPTSHRHSFAVAAPPVAAAAAGSIRAVNAHGTSSHDLPRHLPKSHPPQPPYKPRGKEDAFLASQHNNPKNSGGKNVRQAEQGQEGRNHTDVKALQLSSPFSRDNTATLIADRLSASVRETSHESIGAAAGPPVPAATSLPSLGGNKGAPSSGTCMTASESHTVAPASMCMTANVSAAATAASVGKKRPRTSGLVIEEPPAHQPHLPASQKSPVDDGSRPPSMSPGRMAADGVGKTRTIVSYFHPSGAGGSSSSGHAGSGLQRTGSEAGRAQASNGGGFDVGPHAVCGTMPDHEAVQQALLSQIQNLERQLQEATGEVARLGREREEHEALSTNLREELVRAQDEVQRLKEEAAEKEQRAGMSCEEEMDAFSKGYRRRVSSCACFAGPKPLHLRQCLPLIYSYMHGGYPTKTHTFSRERNARTLGEKLSPVGADRLEPKRSSRHDRNLGGRHRAQGKAVAYQRCPVVTNLRKL